MADLVVIVPSRARPKAADELADAFAATTSVGTWLLFAVDDDDPNRDDYMYVCADRERVTVVRQTAANMVDALNKAAQFVLNRGGASVPLRALLTDPFAVGFCGDDHRPRTRGWDKAYVEALRGLGTGMVYGDDLLQREQLPTQVAMTSDIVRALGHMAPPTFTHLFVDDYWRELGRQAGCLRYLPDVVVEHMHPVAGKADWDEGHRRVNAPQMYAADHAAWTRYRYMDLPGDVAKLKALRSGS